MFPPKFELAEFLEWICKMITEVYDNQDLHCWPYSSFSVLSLGQPSLTSHQTILTNSRAMTGLEESQEQRHDAEERFGL